jgi:hypothetical protein
MTFKLRRAVLSTATLALFAAVLPAACSSKAPTAEPKISGCMSDGECAAGEHCTNGVCRTNCVPANNDCPAGQACLADGRCSASGTGGTGGGDGGGTAGTIRIEAGPDGPANDGAVDPDAACGTGSATAELVPVSMFVMFDRSGSMVMDQDPPTRWDNAAAALTLFFQDPTAADLAIALRYFPHDSPAVGCTNNSTTGCLASACAQPLVPLMADPAVLLPKLTADPAPMDTLEAELVASITASIPTTGMGMSGGTPTYVALEGAVTWAAAYQAAHPRPEQQTVVVFVTDGEPNGCGNDTDAIAQIAANAFMTSGIRTYVVGLTDNPDDLAFLDDLAVAGDTGSAFIVTDGATAAMDLVTTLKAIQGDSLSCNFPFPMAVDGGMPDPNRINVDYTPGVAGSTPVPFFHVENEAACPLDQPAWYYDNNAAPTQINLCPFACMTVSGDSAAKLDILIGCAFRDPPVM